MIAVSGMNAAALRLQVSASNVANAESGGPLPGAANAAGYPAAYNALTVDQTAMADGSTRATVAVATLGTVLAYDPTAPYADALGMLAAPNVDISSQIVQTMLASYSFAANAAVMRSDAQMSASLLNIMA